MESWISVLEFLPKETRYVSKRRVASSRSIGKIQKVCARYDFKAQDHNEETRTFLREKIEQTSCFRVRHCRDIFSKFQKKIQIQRFCET